MNCNSWDIPYELQKRIQKIRMVYSHVKIITSISCSKKLIVNCDLYFDNEKKISTKALCQTSFEDAENRAIDKALLMAGF